MFHACAVRFDVMGNLENFLVFGVNETAKHWLPVDQTQVKTFCQLQLHACVVYMMTFLYSHFLPGVNSSEEVRERGYGSAATNIIDEDVLFIPNNQNIVLLPHY